MGSIVTILIKYQHAFLSGLLVTLKLSLIAWVTGILAGTVIGLSSAKWPLAVGLPTRAASFILSGLPTLVLLFWLHYPAQAILGVVVDPFVTSAAALTIVNAFAVGDIVRLALVDFPSHYTVAARVCGLDSHQIFVRIQVPIILRNTLPGLLVTQVGILQMTLFASLISVEEIFRVSQQINSIEYKPVEIYTALALFFLVVCLPLNGIAIWLRARFTRSLSEQ